MDARSLSSRLISMPAEGRLAAVIARSLLASLEILLALLGAIVCARRLAGSLVSPIQPTGLLLVGGLVAAWSIGVRATCSGLVQRSFAPAVARTLATVPTIIAASVALAICIPGTSARGLVALWGVFIASETISRLPASRFLGRSGASPGAVADSAGAVSAIERRAAAPDPPEQVIDPRQSNLPQACLSDEAGSAVADEICQRILRKREPDGGETIEGLVRVDFTAGERTAHGHVAFCPPFAALPECDGEQVDGPSARIRTAQLFAHGVRFDVKLESPAAAPTSVLVEFSARCGAGHASAPPVGVKHA